MYCLEKSVVGLIHTSSFFLTPVLQSASGWDVLCALVKLEALQVSSHDVCLRESPHDSKTIPGTTRPRKTDEITLRARRPDSLCLKNSNGNNRQCEER